MSGLFCGPPFSSSLHWDLPKLSKPREHPCVLPYNLNKSKLLYVAKTGSSLFVGGASLLLFLNISSAFIAVASAIMFA
jgi:hypothetical protein